MSQAGTRDGVAGACRRFEGKGTSQRLVPTDGRRWPPSRRLGGKAAGEVDEGAEGVVDGLGVGEGGGDVGVEEDEVVHKAGALWLRVARP